MFTAAGPAGGRRAPLQVTVILRWPDGRRHFRLSKAVELPPRVLFAGRLPLTEQTEIAKVALTLPGGGAVEVFARLVPGEPDHAAELIDLPPEQLLRLRQYIEERTGS